MVKLDITGASHKIRIYYIVIYKNVSAHACIAVSDVKKKRLEKFYFTSDDSLKIKQLMISFLMISFQI